MELIGTKQRAKQKADTRERILLAALQLFESNGFASTRTQDVAEAAGISHGSIFSHFITREELILSVLMRFLYEVDATTRKCMRQHTKLHTFLKSHLEAIAEKEVLYTRIIQEQHLLPKEARSLLVEINSAVSSHLQSILQNENSKISLKPSEYYFLFNSWMGTITYYLLNCDLFATKGKVLKKRHTEIIGLFLKLIAKNKGEIA
jgi:AcrR family transcriptional regulator